MRSLSVNSCCNPCCSSISNKEFDGAPMSSVGMLVGMALLYVGAIVMIAFS